MSVQPDNVDWQKEDRQTLIALIKFALNFTGYVKEMDPVLWKRAGEYAADFTKEKDISFTPNDEKDNH